MGGYGIIKLTDWRQPEVYDYTQSHTAGQWAWEFLRRNRTYQREWQSFMESWHALEADYGKPPNRDMCAWREDPRAWVPASDCPAGDCRIDEEKVLIECALGARWGFYKFPPDPRDDDPVSASRLTWRERKIAQNNKRELTEEEKASVEFDLTLPLKPQLERAKRYLQLTRKQRASDGLIAIKRVRSLAVRWRLLIRLLDAEASGATDAEMVSLCESGSPDRLLIEAHGLADSGYLNLLEIHD